MVPISARYPIDGANNGIHSDPPKPLAGATMSLSHSDRVASHSAINPLPSNGPDLGSISNRWCQQRYPFGPTQASCRGYYELKPFRSCCQPQRDQSPSLEWSRSRLDIQSMVPTTVSIRTHPSLLQGLL